MKNIAHFFVTIIVILSVLVGAPSCNVDPPPPSCTQLSAPEYLVISNMVPAADPEVLTYDWATVPGAVDYTFSFTLSRAGSDTTIINNAVTTDSSFTINLPISGVFPLVDGDLLTARVIANDSNPVCSSAPREDITCITKTIVSVEEIYPATDPVTDPQPSTFCNTASTCQYVWFGGDSFSDGTIINRPRVFYFYDRTSMCNCLSSNSNDLQLCMDMLEKCYLTNTSTTCP